jgi:hypothetical protein
VAAQQLLSNDLFIESLQAVENDILSQLRAVRLDDERAHSRLVMALQVTHAVQHQIWLAVQDGYSAINDLNLRGRRID